MSHTQRRLPPRLDLYQFSSPLAVTYDGWWTDALHRLRRMTIAMILPAPGEPPRWGENGAPTAIDPKIEAARTSTVEEQEKLFFHCARYLYDNQVREGVDLRIDPVNNEPWLDALAAWFGWDTERREAVRNKAAAAAMVVLPGETFDGTEPHDR